MRLHGLDIARFFAFCGMVLVNFRIAAQVTPGTDTVSLFTNALEGRAAALFVVLAGVGLSVGKPDRATLFRRALFLFLIGLLNLTIFKADILHFYALYFLVALPFLKASGRVLLLAAAGTVLIGLIGLLALDYEAHWNWETLAYTEFWTPEGFLRHSFFNGWHPVFPWAAFLFLGMWAGRLNLASRTVQARLVLWGAAAAMLGALPRFLVQDPELVELLGTSAIPPGPFYIIAASGSALAVIGLTLAITPALDKAGLAEWLAAPGRQALSLYAAHILLGMGTLEAMGQLDGSLTAEQIFGYSLGFCALSMLSAWIWNLIAKRGPLEALMRWSTNFPR
ncbi:heparan-alpha-glucosaminide N-acetyltransferase domain-containing protein [Leisingera caerulea]|uniref:Heparan-alpha-glucosaminide N-acetyltransferase domain-containing protein n=1 Tax=Leisingera caerulea TaxID=506591 RepID=A0ABY5WT16_LEICA|nr:heparan-alpha-glucosaminide N-acetyltransferase domain-containing protein [Leisingera caerulea]UWQ57463.1 heparan-alpha-glucosaminide N-acetyltransferase domain-containing protein [Leisingera caerulea]